MFHGWWCRARLLLLCMLLGLPLLRSLRLLHLLLVALFSLRRLLRLRALLGLRRLLLRLLGMQLVLLSPLLLGSLLELLLLLLLHLALSLCLLRGWCHLRTLWVLRMHALRGRRLRAWAGWRHSHWCTGRLHMRSLHIGLGCRVRSLGVHRSCRHGSKVAGLVGIRIRSHIGRVGAGIGHWRGHLHTWASWRLKPLSCTRGTVVTHGKCSTTGYRSGGDSSCCW